MHMQSICFYILLIPLADFAVEVLLESWLKLNGKVTGEGPKQSLSVLSHFLANKQLTLTVRWSSFSCYFLCADPAQQQKAKAHARPSLLHFTPPCVSWLSCPSVL